MANNIKRRWGDRPSGDDDEAALAALLNESNARDEKKAQEQNGTQPRPHDKNRGGSGRWDSGGGNNNDRYQRPHERNNSPYGGKPVVEDDRERGGNKRRRRWNDRDPEGPERWGERHAVTAEGDGEEKPEKVKAEFGLSGALATDSKTGNVRNGGKCIELL
jgi:hypothetical protein